jgi:hypothetical protein
MLGHVVGNGNQQKADLQHNSTNTGPSRQADPNETIILKPGPKPNLAKQLVQTDNVYELKLRFPVKIRGKRLI